MQVRQCTAQKLKKVMNFDLTQKYPKRESQSPGACLLTGVSVIWHVVGLGLVIIGVVAIIDVNAELLWETAARQVYHFIGLGAVTIVLVRKCPVAMVFAPPVVLNHLSCTRRRPWER